MSQFLEKTKQIIWLDSTIAEIWSKKLEDL